MPTPSPLRFSEQGRSGTRMLMAMPVTISGKADAGKEFEEKTRTVVINRTGCKLMTDETLAVGSQLTLMIGTKKRSVTVNVVWIGDKKGKQTEIGVDFTTPDSAFWGVKFPDDPSAVSSTGSMPAITSTGSMPAIITAPAAPEAAKVEAPKVEVVKNDEPKKTDAVATTPDPAALAPAKILPPPPPQQPPVPLETSLAKPESSPTAPGDLAMSNVVPISVGRPQIAISDDGMKALGGDLLLGTVQHLVREAFQEVLSQVVEDFDRYCATSIERAKNAALAEMQDRLQNAIATSIQPAVDAGVAGARAQLDNAAREISLQNTQRLEHSMRQMLDDTDKNLESRAAAYDQRLAETAGHFCRELARRMTHVA